MINFNRKSRAWVIAILCLANLGWLVTTAVAQTARVAGIPDQPFSMGMVATLSLIIIIQLIDAIASYAKTRQHSETLTKQNDSLIRLIESQKSVHERLDGHGNALTHIQQDTTTIRAIIGKQE